MPRLLLLFLFQFALAATCLGQTIYDSGRIAWLDFQPIRIYPNTAEYMGDLDLIFSATAAYRLSDRFDLHFGTVASYDDAHGSLIAGIAYIGQLQEPAWGYRADFDLKETLTWPSKEQGGDGALRFLLWAAAGVEVFRRFELGERIHIYPGIAVRKAHAVAGSHYDVQRFDDLLQARWGTELRLQAPAYLDIAGTLFLTATPILIFRNGRDDRLMSLGVAARL